MIRKSLPCIAVVACLLLQVEAFDSSTMEDEVLGFFVDFSEQSQKEIAAANSMDNVNLTGVWSIDLLGQPQEKMKLYLIDKDGTISGQGVIVERDETAKATANGSVIGETISLTVMPAGRQDSYSLNLSLSSLKGGKYTVRQADGSSRSGDFTFSVTSNIFKSSFAASEWDV